MHPLFVLFSFLPTVLSIASPQCSCTEYLKCAETNQIQKTFSECVDHCREKHPLPLPKGYVDCLEEYSDELTKTITCMFKETGPGCTSSIPRPAQERKTEKFKDAVKDKMRAFLEDLGHTWEYTSETAMEMNRCMLRCFYPGRNICSISMKYSNQNLFHSANIRCTLLMRNETEMADTLFKCGKRSGIGKQEMKSLVLCLALITEGNGEMDTEVRDVIEPIKEEETAQLGDEEEQLETGEISATTEGYQIPKRKNNGKESKEDKNAKEHGKQSQRRFGHSKKVQEEENEYEGVDSEEKTDRIVTEGLDRIAGESIEEPSREKSEGKQEAYRLPYSLSNYPQDLNTQPTSRQPYQTNNKQNAQTTGGYNTLPTSGSTTLGWNASPSVQSTTVTSPTVSERRCTILSTIFSIASSVPFPSQTAIASTISVVSTTTPKVPSSWSLTPPSNPPTWNALLPTTRPVSYPSISPPAYPTFPISPIAVTTYPSTYVTVPRK